MIVNSGPDGIKFDFSFDSRSGSVVDSLLAALLSLFEKIPDGIVVFFPSYSYLDQVLIRWKKLPQFVLLNKIKGLLGTKE